MKRFFICMLLTSLVTMFWGTMTCFALKRAVPEKTKEAIVKKYLEGRNLNIIEGLWTWNVNGTNFEVAIINNITEIFKEFEYVGIVTQSDNPSHIGELKMAVKSSNAKGIYPGTYVIQLANTWGQQLNFATNYVLANDNLLETTLPLGYYGGQVKLMFIRTYPNMNSQVTKSSGTGFFIANNLVVTNFHVVDDARDIEVIYQGTTKLPATVVAKDSANDLAILQVSGLENAISPLPVGSVRDVKEGTSVYTVGYPMPSELGSRAKISEGIVNSQTGIEDEIRMFQMSVPIQPGNSGGPLLNSQGQVVGVVTSTLNNRYFLVKKGVVPQNVNFAIKINYLNNLLTVLPDEVKLRENDGKKKYTAEEIMELAKKAVVFVNIKN